METLIFVLFFVLMAFQRGLKSCIARNTINYTNMLSSDETLVSAGKRFELGFFSPDQDEVNDGGTFLGIWYYNLSPRTVVWVANRNAPLFQISGYLVIFYDGNLKLLDSKGAPYFQTNLKNSTTAVNRTLCRLLDSGNLALIDEESGEYLWQSFSEPTDTFLPGMKMDENLRLVSWMDPGNPENGSYTFLEDPEDSKLLMVRNKTILYWRSGDSGSPELPSFLTFFLLNSSKITNGTMSFGYSSTRLLMNSSGEIQFYILDEHYNWSLIWSEPHDACSVFRPCGKFGMCNKPIFGGLRCDCPPEFVPVLPDNWERGDFSNGCTRKDPICNKNSKPDRFLNLKLMNVDKPDTQFDGADSEENCRQECLSNCQTQCEAYYYVGHKRRDDKGGCWIWTSELDNLQQNNVSGHDLYIRLSASAIESTSRDCEPCGRYIIPYPLSSNHNCGDLSYSSFSCNDSTGQLFFLTMNSSYEVIDMNKEEQRFVIQVNTQTADNCSSGTSVLQLNQSLPFDVTNWCYIEQLHLTDVPSRQGRQLIEIGWKPPSEPICNTSFDCQDWPDSNCSAKLQGSKMCLCNSNYRWDGRALKCISGQVTVAANRNHSKTAIIVTPIVAVFLLAVSFTCFFYRRRILAKTGESKESTSGNPVGSFHNNERDVEDLVDEDGNIVDLTYFSLESILEATENFADANKLGEGGFGPVYKGTFPGGKEIAVKRLSSHSGQGMEEFRNEVVLIAKLQHRNLVRLLGYCIKGSEKLLLYEYMQNKSLDSFIYGRCILLDWNLRFDIISGIARGLLYLHQDSRLRIIHRDLKTSNILLDEEMNPKISDFGLARIFAGKETEANTMRVVGTYGYMSPEYAQAGIYSLKSDVFSFGVIVLEMISGKRNTGFYHSGEALSLQGFAWRLWKERNAINLVDDRMLMESSNIRSTEVMIKCINIGLLCVQEDPSDRPTMADVVILLGSDQVTTLASPKQPGFISVRYSSSGVSTSSSRQAERHSVNKMSITLEEGR